MNQTRINRLTKMTIFKVLILGWLTLPTQAQNTVCFDIEANPNTNDAALSSFTKYVNVLDCFKIYAESSISDAKVLHAAAVTAELLDNDEDGIVDDESIKNQLASSNALMPLFVSEGSSAENAFFNNYNGNGISAVLYNNEIDPSQPGHWGNDASVEEILHTINHVGHTFVYPAAFGMSPNASLLTEAMDVARGGQFINHPGTYPDDAWYHYDDTTCDYECMAIEYLYWAIVTNMGILADEATCNGIANEWEPCTPELLQSTDTLMYNLITDTTYNLPQLAPDGNYCPSEADVDDASVLYNFKLFPAYPNPFNPSTTIRFSVKRMRETSLQIFDINGQVVETLVNGTIHSGMHKFQWNASGNSSGIYFVRADAGGFTETKKLVLIK